MAVVMMMMVKKSSHTTPGSRSPYIQMAVTMKPSRKFFKWSRSYRARLVDNRRYWPVRLTRKT